MPRQAVGRTVHFIAYCNHSSEAQSALPSPRVMSHDVSGFTAGWKPMQQRKMQMGQRTLSRHLIAAGVLAACFATSRTGAAGLDPAAVVFSLPDQIKWNENPAAGNANAVLHGDPSKPGLYIVLVKWYPGHMSHPHFHPNDRFITVISGTWWVGTGTKFAPDATVPMQAGSFVTHFGKQIHYDGAKLGETVLEVVGEGPATATPAEEK
jgi:hypothetical protein